MTTSHDLPARRSSHSDDDVFDIGTNTFHAGTEARARRPAGNTDVPIRRRRWLPWLLLAGAVLCVAQASWIHAKAALAQRLLERAWSASLAEGGRHAPWPWADTWPVARLSAPRLQREQIVLAGDDGRALAFGPGWAQASAAPGQHGTTVVSGHRDTHFAWLAELRDGDVVDLDGGTGPRRYVVASARVADASRERITFDADQDQLLLVTCWPFDAVVPGGPLRYVVTATPVDSAVGDSLANVER